MKQLNEKFPLIVAAPLMVFSVFGLFSDKLFVIVQHMFLNYFPIGQIDSVVFIVYALTAIFSIILIWGYFLKYRNTKVYRALVFVAVFVNIAILIMLVSAYISSQAGLVHCTGPNPC